MKLITLGGSAGGPNPRDACSGYLIQDSGTSLLLDCGSGVLSQLRSFVDVRNLDAIIVSHFHADHTLDLVALRYILMYAPNQRGHKRIPLFLPPGGFKFLVRMAIPFQMGDEKEHDFWCDVFDPHEYDPSAALRLRSLTVRFSLMPHYIPSWAMRITNEPDSQVITYSGDTGPDGTLAEFAMGSDLLLCEATYLEYPPIDEGSRQAHLTAWDAGRIASAASARRLVLTHLWVENGLDNYINSAKTHFQGQVEVATSGACFEI